MAAERVTAQYGRTRPIDRIRAQLVASGHDPEHLEHGAPAGVDDFHCGGRMASLVTRDGVVTLV